MFWWLFLHWQIPFQPRNPNSTPMAVSLFGVIRGDTEYNATRGRYFKVRNTFFRVLIYLFIQVGDRYGTCRHFYSAIWAKNSLKKNEIYAYTAGHEFDQVAYIWIIARLQVYCIKYDFWIPVILLLTSHWRWLGQLRLRTGQSISHERQKRCKWQNSSEYFYIK